MMLTLIILTVIAGTALGWWCFQEHRAAGMWRLSYKQACDQSRENARVANVNYTAALAQKKNFQRMMWLFWATWFLCLFCYIGWVRAARRNSAA